MKLPKAKKLPSGSWNVQVMVDGKRVSVTAPTEKEAVAQAMQVKAGMVEARKQEQAGAISLEDAITRYTAQRSHVLSPSTVEGYEEIRRNRFRGLMKKKIRAIGPQQLQEAINQEAGNGISAKTIRNALGLVSSVLEYFGVPVDTKRLKLPQRKREEHKIMDAADIVDLFDKIRGNTVEIPILLAVWLGMRRSEIMGLCWDCIDSVNSTITVRRTYVRGKDGYVLRDGTKTEASRRVLDCPAYIMEKLVSLRPAQYQSTDRVFTIHPNTIYQSMRRICEKEGIDFVGVHGLRHTNASVMLSLGVLDKAAMARGGWSTDVTMKQVYHHLFRSDLDAATVLVNQFFGQIAQGVNPQKLQTNLQTENTETQ